MKQLILILFLITVSIKGYSQGNEKLYEKSYTLLTQMLSDTTTYSFKKAVFSVENAYLHGNLDTIWLQQEIDFLVTLCDKITQSRTLLDYAFKDKDKVSKSASIFTMMRDSIPIKTLSKDYQYTPYSYDFNDIWGEEDWSNMFVSKLFESKKGNCHSLPYLYKILAEEIGVDASLALAPNHIYIKQRNLKDGWYNTELTSGFFPVDAWIMASGYVHLDGIRNGLYMKALNNSQTIALLLTDLAQSYEKQFPISDGSFVLKCCNIALQYYPNLINALLLQLETTKKELEYLGHRENKEIYQKINNPKAKGLWKDITKQVQHIHELGYRQMPKEMYLDWLVSLQNEKAKYTNKNIRTFTN